MSQCPSVATWEHPLYIRCELTAGHPGPHVLHGPNGSLILSWDDPDPNWCRWIRQAVDRLKERGEWDEAWTAGASPPAEGQPHGVDTPNGGSARHGDQVA